MVYYEVYYFKKIMKAFKKNSPILIYVKDKKFRFKFFTDNLKSVFYYKHDNYTGKTDYDTFLEKDADSYRKMDMLVRNSDHPISKIEYVNTDGKVLAFNSTKFMIDKDLLIGLSIDVTETEIQHEKLIEINKFLTHINYIIRHDLKSNINNVKQFYKTVNKRINHSNLEEDKVIGAFKLLGKCIERLDEVYSGIYDLSIMVDSDKEIPLEEFCLKDALVSSMGKTHLYSFLKIDKLGLVYANKSLLLTALYNFVKNGIAYNNSDKKLIYFYREDNNLLIQDNGLGLSQKEFDFYLKPYVRGHNTKGSGLGLTISNLILKNHKYHYTFEKNDIGTKIVIFNIFI